ncbi:MAG TPA: hypothetical protein GX743_07815 [Actinomycetales bacterium]|nr:hypothetical protein [Actinomycetales bacterium]
MAPGGASRIVASRLEVSGIESHRDVRRALQELFDVFASNGLGQATFELGEGGRAVLWIKHLDTVEVDGRVIQQALSRAGDYTVVGDPRRAR